jgi:hypothetical protein
MKPRHPSSGAPPKSDEQEEEPFGFDRGERPSFDSAADLADYIAEMARELADLARDAKMELVAYFLGMAHVESAGIARRERTRSGDQ